MYILYVFEAVIILKTTIKSVICQYIYTLFLPA